MARQPAFISTTMVFGLAATTAVRRSAYRSSERINQRGASRSFNPRHSSDSALQRPFACRVYGRSSCKTVPVVFERSS